MLNIAEMRRYGLIAALIVVGYLMVRAWNEDFSQRLPATNTQVATTPTIPTASPPLIAPPTANPVTTNPATSELPQASGNTAAAAAIALVEVTTDTLHAWIDSYGDVVKVELPGYPLSLERKDLPTVLLDRNPQHVYIAESGLVGVNGPDLNPNGRPIYHSIATNYALPAGAKNIEVPMEFVDAQGVRYVKTYTFRRGSYQIHLDIGIDNRSEKPWQGNLYAQLHHDGVAPSDTESSAIGPKPYFGAALTTAEKNYEKFSFSDIKGKQIVHAVTGGWIAILQHYFLVSWIATSADKNDYFGREARDGSYRVGFTGPTLAVPAHHQISTAVDLYAGPKVQAHLAAAAPNLEKTVDYGVLWMIASPLFKMLQALHGVFHNWGAAIIALTVSIKLLLYPLSAYSYRAMAKMRDVAPEMKRLQERHADDREKLSREMMDLYKREKVNPLGGCLPMLVQMPVFLSLYWVLYESVELRQAPFVGWIVDLSIKDPLFILPLLMGGSMFLTQLLSPPMPDPMQARMMKMMPIVFTVMFAFFPAGLVLYWVVNNTLSFAQQWWVTRQVTRARA